MRVFAFAFYLFIRILMTMTQSPPPRDIVLERMAELRGDMVDLRKQGRDTLQRMTAMESVLGARMTSLESGIAARLTSIENLLRIVLADLAHITAQADQHHERLYALEHEGPASEDRPNA